MLLLLLSFFAGIITVLTPCVLPMLPVIIGGSIAEGVNRRKAFTVTISLGISVILFTFLLKVTSLFIMIPEQVWQWISGAIIAVLGIIMLVPGLWEKLGAIDALNKESNKLLAAGFKKKSITGDILMGAALGPVFSSCSPTYFIILATVLPQSPLWGFIDLLAYSIGLTCTLLLVALLGQKLISKLGLAVDPKGWFRRGVGILLILIGIAIFTGVDKAVETNLQSGGYFDATKVEQQLLINENSK
jgi:cytochrome c biogenesis protein CcdA